jgi:signal transduction histidine kinase
MRPFRGIGTRLLLADIVVVAIGAVTLLLTVGIVAPAAFDWAMGRAMSGSTAMDNAQTAIDRATFQDAVRVSLIIAGIAATIAAVAVSVALSFRLSRPIRRLAQAGRRIASGRYAERVAMWSGDEIDRLAESFNTLAESLETMERRRLEVVGDVAHELRTPLATLNGYLEGLEDGVIEPGDATWKLLHEATARMAGLVESLQELWRAEARQLPLSIEPVDLGAVAAAAVQRWSAVADGRSVEIRLDATRAQVAMADRERLKEVVDILLSNASRYTAEGTVITVSVRGDDESVTLSVDDQGPGLTEEQRAKVFEHFYRIDPSRSRALGGSGIGLAIAKALVGLMDGKIWAESAGPGEGATFRVELPRAR